MNIIEGMGLPMVVTYRFAPRKQFRNYKRTMKYTVNLQCKMHHIVNSRTQWRREGKEMGGQVVGDWGTTLGCHNIEQLNVCATGLNFPLPVPSLLGYGISLNPNTK